MKLKFCKVDVGKPTPQKTFTRKVFRYYMEVIGYTRKEFTTILGVNHRIFTNGVKAYYTKEQIEKLKAKKIVKTNIGNRVRTWDEKLKNIERFIPGFTKLFITNTKENPEIVIRELLKINDEFYKFKQALKPIKKYLNQSLTRLGKDRLNMVGNGLEAKVKFILDDLGINYQCQFKLGKFFYDFRVNNTLIEVDGRQYHGKGINMPKDKLAKLKGFKVLRLPEIMILRQPLKIKGCLKKLV